MSDSRPFGFYDHFNDVLYRGPLAWVEADKARMGGNQITALFDLSSAECLLAKRVAEIDELTALLNEARLAVLREYGRNKREGGPEERTWSDLLNRMQNMTLRLRDAP